MAPEVLMNNESLKASDVYSFAMIIYELLTNEKPFKGLNHYEIVKEVVQNENRPPFNKDISSCYRTLIEKCWQKDPNKRPTFSEIVSILNNDQNFITEKVNKELFHKYIQFINGEANDINEFASNETILNSHFELISESEIETNPINFFSINSEQIELNGFVFDKKNLLGEGSFGKVFKISDKKTGEFYAAKILKHYLNKYSLNQILNIKREVENISKLSFPSIIKFIGYNYHNFHNKPKLTIITEFVENGNLDEILYEEDKKKLNEIQWNDTKKLIIFFGIAAGMAHVHAHNIIHRDLKPANIFLDKNLHPKIGDFGLSKNLSGNFSFKKLIGQSGIKGSYAFIAPEIFTNIDYQKSCDVFAFALIVYQTLTNDPFYRDFSRYKILLQVPNGLRPVINNNVPACYRNLMTKCWSPDPNERLSFIEIVNLLKNDESFITENVNKDEFLKYVHEIE